MKKSISSPQACFVEMKSTKRKFNFHYFSVIVFRTVKIHINNLLFIQMHWKMHQMALQTVWGYLQCFFPSKFQRYILPEQTDFYVCLSNLLKSQPRVKPKTSSFTSLNPPGRTTQSQLLAASSPCKHRDGRPTANLCTSWGQVHTLSCAGQVPLEFIKQGVCQFNSSIHHPVVILKAVFRIQD